MIMMMMMTKICPKILNFFFKLYYLFYFGVTAPSAPWPFHSKGFQVTNTKTHHSRQKSSRRVISSSQRPLPDFTQHSQQTDMPTDSLSRRATADLRLRPRGHWNRHIQGESLARGPKLFSMYAVEQRGFLFRKYQQTGSFKACQTAFRTEFCERCAPSKCCIQ